MAKKDDPDANLPDEKNPRKNYAEVWESTEDGLHYWHVKAANGEVVANGEGYVSQSGAVDRVNSLFPEMEVRIGNKKKAKAKGGGTSGDLMAGKMPAIDPKDIIIT